MRHVVGPVAVRAVRGRQRSAAAARARAWARSSRRALSACRAWRRGAGRAGAAGGVAKSLVSGAAPLAAGSARSAPLPAARLGRNPQGRALGASRGAMHTCALSGCQCQVRFCCALWPSPRCQPSMRQHSNQPYWPRAAKSPRCLAAVPPGGVLSALSVRAKCTPRPSAESAALSRWHRHGSPP